VIPAAFVVYALYVHLAGLAVLGLVRTSLLPESRIGRLGLAGSVGMGVVYLACIGQLALGRPVRLWVLFTLLAVLTGWHAWRARRESSDHTPAKPPPPERAPRHWYQVVLLVGLVVSAGLMTFAALWWPVTAQDAWAQWAGNAKFLFFHGPADATYFRSVNHASYPLFVMLNEVVLCRLVGHWDEFLCTAWAAVLVVDFLLVLYAIGRAWAGRTAGLAAAFITACIPLFLQAGLDATAEAPMAVFVALAAFATLHARETARPREDLVAGFLAGMLLVVKSEAIVAVALLVLLRLWPWGAGPRHGYTRRLVWLLPVAAFWLPWMWLKHTGASADSRLDGFALAPLAHLDTWAQVLRTWAAALAPHTGADLPRWFWRATGLLGPTFAAAAVYWITENRSDAWSRAILLLMTGVAVLYAAGAYATGWGTEYPRLLTHLSGLVPLFALRQVRAWREGAR